MPRSSVVRSVAVGLWRLNGSELETSTERVRNQSLPKLRTNAAADTPLSRATPHCNVAHKAEFGILPHAVLLRNPACGSRASTSSPRLQSHVASCTPAHDVPRPGPPCPLLAAPPGRPRFTRILRFSRGRPAASLAAAGRLRRRSPAASCRRRAVASMHPAAFFRRPPCRRACGPFIHAARVSAGIKYLQNSANKPADEGRSLPPPRPPASLISVPTEGAVTNERASRIPPPPEDAGCAPLSLQRRVSVARTTHHPNSRTPAAREPLHRTARDRSTGLTLRYTDVARVPDCRSGGWGFESPRPRLVLSQPAPCYSWAWRSARRRRRAWVSCGHCRGVLLRSASTPTTRGRRRAPAAVFFPRNQREQTSPVTTSCHPKPTPPANPLDGRTSQRISSRAIDQIHPRPDHGPRSAHLARVL